MGARTSEIFPAIESSDQQPRLSPGAVALPSASPAFVAGAPEPAALAPEYPFRPVKHATSVDEAVINSGHCVSAGLGGSISRGIDAKPFTYRHPDGVRT